MALLFLDSFDHYATADLPTKWTASVPSGGNVAHAISAATGRRSAGSFRMSTSAPSGSVASYLSKALAPTGATCVMGFAFAFAHATVMGATGVTLATIRDSATTQLSLRLNPDLTLSVVRGIGSGTVLGTTAVALTVGSFVYLEWKALIDPSVGTAAVQLNGVSRLALTAQNTRATANSSWNGITIGPADVVAGQWNGGLANSTLDWDDLYVLDGSGSAPLTTFLGDVRVDARYPTGAGATTGWTPSAGANWAAVDDAAPNGDTDYVAATTVVTDTYATQDAPVAGATIYGVQHCLSLKKSDAGACTVAPVIRHSGVDYPGADLAPGTAYAYGLQIAAVNPGTGAAWTEAGFNAAEFGVKRTA